MVRSTNEDSIFVSDGPVGGLPNLYIVADGMGGCNAGEVASARAISYFCEYVEQQKLSGGDILDYMIGAATDANNRVYRLSLTDASMYGMGTTFTACVIDQAKLYIAHIGDSRAYILSPAGLSQLTTDHSYVNEMYKAGHLTKEQAECHPRKNLLTRVLGVEEDTLIDGVVHSLAEGERVLICSDGPTNMLSDEAIWKIASEAMDEAPARLIAAANDNVSLDNISVIIAEGERGR
jgi:protein phosphatase